MFSFLLAIDEWERPRAQDGDQVRQRDLRRIGFTREHRFAEEHLPDRDAVKASDKPPIVPRLDRMCIAALMQCRVSVDSLWRDPGTRLSWPPCRRARVYNCPKIRIGAYLPALLLDALAQRARHTKFVDEEHHPRVWTPPQDGLVAAVPRKDSVTIGVEKTVGSQVVARGKKPVRFCERGLERRKRRPVSKPRNHLPILPCGDERDCRCIAVGIGTPR